MCSLAGECMKIVQHFPSMNDTNNQKLSADWGKSQYLRACVQCEIGAVVAPEGGCLTDPKAPKEAFWALEVLLRVIFTWNVNIHQMQ